MRSALLLLCAAGCGTYGVDVVERQVKASHPADGISRVLAQISVQQDVYARGGGSAIDASMELVAWLEPDASAELLDRVTIDMVRSGSDVAVRPDNTGEPTEQIVLGDLDLVLADPLALDLEVSHGAVEVSDLSGPVRVVAPNSNVTLERTGPVDVAATQVTAHIGAGGSIATESGSVVVSVLGSDFDQLLVTTDTGPVTIHLPPDHGWDIEVSTSSDATATVDLGGLRCGDIDDPCGPVRFGAGGPLIRVESNGGVIAVDDLL